MTDRQTDGPLLRAGRRDTARQLIDQASGELVYYGTVATLAVVSLIACGIWLLDTALM